MFNNKFMKIVFFGTPEIAVPFLVTLHNDKEIDVLSVVTKPDKPVGRKQEMQAPPVKLKAQELNYEVLQPEKIDSEFIEEVNDLNADFFIVIAYGEILPKEILDSPKYASINVHFSLLPKYRGASPVQSALLNGDSETGITFMDMNEKLDAGGVFFIKKIPIEGDDNAEKLLIKLSELGAILLPSVLKDISDGVLSPIPQNEDDKTYCKKITKKDAEINPSNDNAEQIFNKFRAFYPWPGLFFIFENKRCKILDCELSTSEVSPGELKEVDGVVILGCKKGSIKIDKLQLEGKKPMFGKDFINGFL